MTSSGSYSTVPKEEYEVSSTSNSDLEENLVGPDPSSEEMLPAATSVPMLQVVAPATLPEGYEFQAVSGNQTFSVKVPPGGIEKGQRFEVPFPVPLESSSVVWSGIRIPVGEWRDGLFCSLFRYGVCHPHCWTACCCTLLAAGQVITRLKLTACGLHGTPAQTARAFQIIFAAVAIYFTIAVVLRVVFVNLDPNTSRPLGSPRVELPTSLLWLWLFMRVIDLTFGMVTWAVLINLRGMVRSKYAIPGSPAGDCCCAFWCTPCVAGQLLRHTTDYDVYPATCCTERGIPPHAPSIV